MPKHKLSRREFLKLTGAAAAVAAVGGVAPKRSALAFPTLLRQSEPLRIGVGGWAVDSMTELLEELEFTRITGIPVQVLTRPGAPDEMITQLAAGAQASTSPYDFLDVEDELIITGSRAGWFMGLDDLLEADFWDDWPEGMLDRINAL